MNKHIAAGLWAGIFALSTLHAGGVRETPADQEPEKAKVAVPATRSVEYLGTTYPVPPGKSRLVLASLEAMEDAAALGVTGVGVVTDGIKVPDYLEKAMGAAVPVGGRQQPNPEAILALAPDVILGTTKFPQAMKDQLSAIATHIPVSHVALHWKDNLRLLADLTDTRSRAEEIISRYEKDLAALKTGLARVMEGKKVFLVRLRAGSINLYPAGVYFNPSLYADLGLPVPAEIQTVKAQETVSLERLATMAPDVLFVQFAANENRDHPQALKDLEANPLWQAIPAVRNHKVWTNIVDPYHQGGSSLSKIRFLEALQKVRNALGS